MITKNVIAAILKRPEDHKILIAQREIEDKNGGKWEFPGGKLEAGETPEQCLHRELAEELDIKVKVGKFLGKSEYDYVEKQVKIKLQVYWADCLTFDFQLNVHMAIRWISISELQEYDFTAADTPIIKQLMEEL